MKSERKVYRRTIVGGLLLALASAGAASADTPIRISYQPAIYGLGIEIATDKGWWEEIGLDPTFSIFPTGAPQIAAATAGDWDVGLLGAPPAVLGAARIDLKTIGLATEEGNANVVLARPDEIEAIRADPSSLKGKPILVSTNSTGEFASWGCMEELGLERADMQFVNLAPAQIVSAFANGEGALAATFTPFVYTLQQQSGAEVLCSATDAGLFLMSAIVTRPEFAEQDSEAVAKFLATYLRAIAWQKENPEEALAYLKTFYERNGVMLEDSYMMQEMTTDRQQMVLDEQVELFSRADGSSTIDDAFENFMAYLMETGTIQEMIDPQAFITDEYLRMIADDEELRAWAAGQ